MISAQPRPIEGIRAEMDAERIEQACAAGDGRDQQRIGRDGAAVAGDTLFLREPRQGGIAESLSARTLSVGRS